MENNLSTKQDYKLNYSGKGSDLFGIIVINWLLTVITLGFYYPWAKAKVLQYVYGSSSLNNDAFSFHGASKICCSRWVMPCSQAGKRKSNVS